MAKISGEGRITIKCAGILRHSRQTVRLSVCHVIDTYIGENDLLAEGCAEAARRESWHYVWIGIDYSRPKDWVLYFRLWDAAVDWVR